MTNTGYFTQDGLFVYDPSAQQAVDYARTRADMQASYNQILQQRQQDIDFANEFVKNIGELKTQTAELHQDYINEEIDQLYADVNENIVKRNKKGKVVGLNINNPDFRSEVRNRVNRISMMNDRSKMLADKMEVYAKAEKENPYLDYRLFYEDLAATASDPRLLATGVDADMAFNELVDKYDKPEIRLQKFIESNAGEKTNAFDIRSDQGRKYEYKLEGRANYHIDGGNVRPDIQDYMTGALSQNGDQRLNAYLVRQYQKQLKLDPVNTPQINDPVAQASYMASKAIPSMTISNRRDITDDSLDTAKKRADLAKAGKEKEQEANIDLLVDNLLSPTKILKEQGIGVGTFPDLEATREEHTTAMSVLNAAAKSGGKINNVSSGKPKEVINMLKETMVDGVNYTKPEDVPDNVIAEKYGITDGNERYLVIDWKEGSKDAEVIPINERSRPMLVEIAKNLVSGSGVDAFNKYIEANKPFDPEAEINKQKFTGVPEGGF